MKLEWAALSVVSILSVGCGGVELGEQVKLKLDPLAQTAALEVEMSSGTELSLAGEFPLDEGRATLSFVPATRMENAKIRVNVDLSELTGGYLSQLGSVATLPNGAPLPVAMTPPLVAARVIKNQGFEVDAVLAMVPELQVGALVGIDKMSNRYVPEGLSLCQNFRNQENKAIAAICVYGPGNNRFGGVFVGANFGEVIRERDSTDVEEVQSLVAGRAFLMSTAPAASYQLDSALDFSSRDWTAQTHDPKKRLHNPSTARKTYNNLSKIFGVKAH